MAKEYKKRTPKYVCLMRHDRANTEELKNVGSRATLNGARKLAVAKLKGKMEKGIYDYSVEIMSLATNQNLGTVVYHPKKGAFYSNGKVVNSRTLGVVPTLFPIAPDGSLLRPIGSTVGKKLAKETPVRSRKKKRASDESWSYGAREQDLDGFDAWEEE